MSFIFYYICSFSLLYCYLYPGWYYSQQHTVELHFSLLKKQRQKPHEKAFLSPQLLATSYLFSSYRKTTLQEELSRVLSSTSFSLIFSWAHSGPGCYNACQGHQRQRQWSVWGHTFSLSTVPGTQKMRDCLVQRRFFREGSLEEIRLMDK